MKKIYPFKFLDAYEKEDKVIFFGRDEEINELYDMVFQSSVILLYGASGTGKTSLINCGLAGKFQPHDWYPLMIRRGNNINDSLEKALKGSGGDFSGATNDINWDDEFTYGSSETDIVLSPVGNAIKSIYLKSFRPIYLIFDQFEELFILGSSSEHKLFINTVKDILSSNQPVKILFSIREEYLGHLFDFEQAVPQLMQRKLRIEPMNLAKVKQVIVGATQFDGSIISLKEGEADEIASGIFEKIKGKQKSLTIQLPFLQVFLDKFYRKISGDPKHLKEAQFSVYALNEMSDIGDILVDFLEEQVGEIAKNLSSKYSTINSEMVWKILSPLSTLEGTKEPISKPDLYGRLNESDPNMIDDTIEAFINSRILRYNENTQLYEISHDALAKPISEKRSVEEKTLLEIRRIISSQVNVKKEAREFFTERQIHFIEPYLDRIKLSQEENELITNSRKYIRKTKRRRKLRIAASFAILIIAFLFMTFLFITNKQARAANYELYNSYYKMNDNLVKEQKASIEKNKQLDSQTVKLEAQTSQLEEQKIKLQEDSTNLKQALDKSEIAVKTALAAELRAENAKKESDTVRNVMRRIAIKGKKTIDLFKDKEDWMFYYIDTLYQNIRSQYYYQSELDSLSSEIAEYASKLRTLTPYKDPYYNMWGYIDSENNIAIFPSFSDAKEFIDDIAQVKFSEKNIYYQINKEGEIIGVMQENDAFVWEESGIEKEKPKNMFVGGNKIENGVTTDYCICRGYWVEGKHIGRLEKDDKCHFGWGGVERITDEYDVLTKGSSKFEYKWVPQNDVSSFESQGWIKFIGAWNDNFGEELYIGQSEYEGQLMPGKIWEKYSNNYVVFNGIEIEWKTYSYLMIKKK